MDFTPRPFSIANDPRSYYNGYIERERIRQEIERKQREAQEMLIDEDLEDRVTLFMVDLSELAPGAKLSDLPHHGLYFNSEETNRISVYTRLSDEHVTPPQLLESMEQVFPKVRYSKDAGPANPTKTRIDWIRNYKVCIPGTIRGVGAREMHIVRLEHERRKRAEMMEEAERKAKMKQAAAKRRETLKRKKLASLGTSCRSESDVPSTSPSVIQHEGQEGKN
jgi:hypothetical protein